MMRNSLDIRLFIVMMPFRRLGPARNRDRKNK